MLLIEVMTDAIPVRPPGAFDKEVLMVADQACLSHAHKLEYKEVFSCEEVLLGSGKKFCIRPSSNLYIGIVVGLFSAHYKLTFITSRLELYSNFLRSSDRLTYVPLFSANKQPQPDLEPRDLVPVYQPTLGKQASLAISYAEFRKTCNYFLNSVMLSKESRGSTVSKLLRQMRKLLSKKLDRVNNLEKALGMMYEAFLIKGYFKVKGEEVQYIKAKCRHSAFPITETLFLQLNDEPVKRDKQLPIPSEVKRDNQLPMPSAEYLKACKLFLIYISTKKKRGLTSEGVVGDLAHILGTTYQKPQARRYALIIFNSFQAKKYFTVGQGLVTYNSSLCVSSKLTEANVPPQVNCQANDSQPSNETALAIIEKKPQLKEFEEAKVSGGTLHDHVYNVVKEVVSSSYLETPLRIMETLQQALMAYQKKRKVVFDANEVREVIKTSIMTLRSLGYKIELPFN